LPYQPGLAKLANERAPAALRNEMIQFHRP
jgi:hypothetical protein